MKEIEEMYLDCEMLADANVAIPACDVDDDNACKRRRCSTATVCASSDKEQERPEVVLPLLMLVPEVLPLPPMPMVRLDLPEVDKLLLWWCGWWW
jgi:hypothetical protein